MAGLFGGGGPSTNAQETPALDHIVLQSSSYGQPIPIIYGTQRLGGSLIWYDEFRSERHEQKQEVGKGGSQETTNVSYTYSACIQMALCEGPITSFGRVWADKECKASPGGVGFEATSLGPRSNPTPWAHLTSVHPAKAISYGGTAYVAAAKLNLPNAQLPNHTFEVRGFQATRTHSYTDPRGISQTAYDAHPMDILIDLLTSVDYGLGWDASRIVANVGADGTAGSSFENYCHALGFYLSLALTQQQTAIELVAQVLDASNACAVWSQGKLKILPLGDTSATGNGFTFTPDNTAIYNLDGDDFLEVADMDPIQVERSNVEDTYNAWPIEYTDRAQDYKESIAEDIDQADVELFGLRRADPVQAHFVTRPEVALALSRLRAQRSIWVRNTYKFKLPQRYILLEPMDLVTLTEPKLGLDKKLVRIKTVEEQAEDGTFDITAEECPLGIATHTLYTGQVNDGTATNFGADPGDANAPIGLIPTLQLTDGALEFWLVTNGGPNWGGAEVHVSDDNTTFSFAGTAQRARYGTLVNTITSSDTTIDVDLSASGGELTSTSATGAADDLTAIWIDGEVISYETATLTGPNAYQLTGVLRGRQSTVAGAHTAGAECVRLDQGVTKHPLAYTRLGQTIYVKLVSFNSVGGGKQDISTLSSYTFAIPSAPDLLPKVTNVTIDIATSPHP